ncbi:MAG: hypothetical protein AAF357_06445 [Verrucomicrobiota bacterium]
MSEEEKQIVEDPMEAEREPQPLKNQVGALLVLLVVFGAVWGLFKILPEVGDWIGDTADTVITKEGEELLPVSTVEPPPPAKESSPEREIDPVSTESPNQLDFYRQQIIEQLGGEEKVEVRHLALSQDETRMVVALKIKAVEAGSGLVEVFFEQDEFGRFLSTDDSPLDELLKLWSE